MLRRVLSARALAARGLTDWTSCGDRVALIGLSGSPAWSAPKDIKWGTGPVGSSGHKALVVLADILNKEMPELRISVLPYPGAVGTVKGFATGDLEGYYGSDVALKEFADRQRRFKGFKSQSQSSARAVALVLHARYRRRHQGQRPRHHQVVGRPDRQGCYTGPLPFDTRKQLENALKAIGVKHIYKPVDMKTAGSQLASGRIKAMIIYAAGGKTPAPWISEASLAVDWVGLNPSADELAKLKAKKFATGR